MLLRLAKEQSLAIRVLDRVGELLRETPRIDVDIGVSRISPQKKQSESLRKPPAKPVIAKTCFQLLVSATK